MIFNLADTHLFFNDLEVRPVVFLSSSYVFLTSVQTLFVTLVMILVVSQECIYSGWTDHSDFSKSSDNCFLA